MDRRYPVTDISDILHTLHNIDTGDTDLNLRLFEIYQDLNKLYMDIIYKELSEG